MPMLAGRGGAPPAMPLPCRRRDTDGREEARVIKQRATKRYGVAQNHKPLGELKRRIHNARGLGGGKLGRDVQPDRGIHRAVKGGILHGQAAAVPEQAHEEKAAGKKLLRTWKESAGMRGDLLGQVTKGRGESISNRNGSYQGADKFHLRMTRTRQEVLNQETGNHQNRKDQAANPPGDQRRRKTQSRFWKELKEDNAGGDQDTAAKKEASAENQ